jgi:hypothetical protein
MMSARMRLVVAHERDASEDVRAVFVRRRLTFANERLVFARGRSTSRDRPSMETFDCRMDGERRRLAVRPGREKRAKRRDSRLSTYVLSADRVLASGQFLPIVKASLDGFT